MTFTLHGIIRTALPVIWPDKTIDRYRLRVVAAEMFVQHLKRASFRVSKSKIGGAQL